MSFQQAVQPQPAANGFGNRRNEKDGGARLENKLQTGKMNPGRSSSISKEGGYESASRERLVYLTTCLIGHQVEAEVLDGSVFSGIFHATNAEKDFGIILKMARLTKDGSRGQKNVIDSTSNAPSTTLVIAGKELVQVIAKGVPVTRDGLTSELQHERQQELLIDSSISRSRHVEMERVLERWVPEDERPELENIFSGHRDRGWDQFQVNETLFGVKSTFNEELYTTKLEKGPRTKELEMEALRIAREIEGEDTHDLHLAEERGLQLHENCDVDEETRFSSVFRGADDSGYDDDEDILLDTHNDETFGGNYVSSVGKPFADWASVKSKDGAQVFARSSPLEKAHSSHFSTSREEHQSASDDHFKQLSTGHMSKESFTVGDNRDCENQFADNATTRYSTDDAGNQMVSEEAQTSKPDDSWSSLQSKIESSDKGRLSANASAHASSLVSSKDQEKPSTSDELSQGIGSSTAQGTAQSTSSRVHPSSSAPSTSDCGGGSSASGGPGLSPSSSMGSFSSEKSTLNPHAKEFKLNPNAKIFVPSQTPLRPASPVSDGSFYYPANMAAVSHMHGMPVGMGIGPSFAAHQPIIFNPQAAPAPQPYFHPSGPQYGRQMMIGHPQQVVYMPTTYNPEMPYKGREF